MDVKNIDILKNPIGKPGLAEASGSFNSEEEKKACMSYTPEEELTYNESWSQRTISRLLRSTLNPRMRWLLPGHSQDDYEEEDEEEGNFVVACNLVSRSSARILRLQHALLSVSGHWQHVSGAQMGSSKMCIKGRTASVGSFLMPSLAFLAKHYQALWRLLEQRSLLLFIHEFTRRAHATAAYICKLGHLLEDHLRKSHLSTNQTLHLCTSAKVHLVSLCQEFRIHLNHWSCLLAKIQSDHYLRRALAQQTMLLEEIRQTLDLLGLQVLILMEHYVHAVLFAMGQSDLHHLPKEVMADILNCTDLYNKTLEEQRVQHSKTHLRTKMFQQVSHTALTKILSHQTAAVSVKDLLSILAAHQGNIAANQLHLWAAQQCMCKSLTSQEMSARLLSRYRSTLTWEQLQDRFLKSCSHFKTSHIGTPEFHMENTNEENHQHCSDLEKANISFFKDTLWKSSSFQCQTSITSNTGPAQTDVDQNIPLRNFQHLQKSSQPTSFCHFSTNPLSTFCQQDQSKVELLLHVLVSSNDLTAPLLSHSLTPTIQLFPQTVTRDILPSNMKAQPSQMIKDCRMAGTQQEIVDLSITTRLAVNLSSGAGHEGLKVAVGEDAKKAEDECAQLSHSVQWLDLGQSMLFNDLFRQYHTLLWARCSKALWLQIYVPHRRRSTGSINLHDNHRIFQVLQMISQASKTNTLSKDCKAMLEEFNLNVLVSAAHAQWDYVTCRGLGSALKDKRLTVGSQHSRSLGPSLSQHDSVMMSVTMDYLLQLIRLLLFSLSYCSSPGSVTCFPAQLTFHRRNFSLMSATAQLSTVWVMSKAYQFLSSWSLEKFLHITQGDLKVLTKSLDKLVQQTKFLMINSDRNCLSTLHIHKQLVLKQQIQMFDSTCCELQAFSSLMLKTFSHACKRTSANLFEQTMPSAGHWRLNPRSGFSISPSEYVSHAAQNVIGQVLDGVALLSDDIRTETLSLTMTAFMEAWMEHILKQQLKFSVHGALQLKQDFDSIREFICSDKYGLPEELIQQLLSLRVFQQVDSAVLCLLKQPQVRPYLQTRAWEAFIRCCPTKRSGDSLRAAVGSNITNLKGMEGDYITQSNPSILSTDIPVDPFSSGEPYLVPSLALGATQQDWLDLRIHTSSRRWRLPGLHCLSESEP